MPTWGFIPQEVFAETLTADVRRAPVGPQNEVVGRAVDDVTRGFRLRYTLVTSSDASLMAAFYRDRRGAFEAFDFPNPDDSLAYLVRFDSSMRLEFFTPLFFRQGNELVLTVVTS